MRATLLARRRSARRLQRSSRAVASAVATLFIILLIAVMLANYLSVTFPNQMQSQEFQHTLQVGDEFLQLQANINTEIAHPGSDIALTTPVDLAGQGVPPFGPPAASSLVGTPSTVDNATYEITEAKAGTVGPTWNTSSAGFCGAGVAWYDTCNLAAFGACGASAAYIDYNVSYRTLTTGPSQWTVTGGNDCIFLNISGSHNNIVLNLGTRAQSYVLVVVEGNFNQVQLDAGANSSRGENFLFFGQYNTYNLSATGAHVNVNTTFAGFNPASPVCPFQNTSNTDSWNVVADSGQPARQNLTWYNLQYPSWNTPLHWQPMYSTAGSTHAGDVVGFQNITGQLSCPFGATVASVFSQGQFGGITDQLLNRYSPQVTYSYEEGAVVEESSSGSDMLGGPLFSVQPVSGGYLVSLTLVQLIPYNVSAQEGTGVVGLQTWLISETHDNLTVGGTGFSLTSPQTFSIVTPNPTAWVNWAAGYPSVFPDGGSVSGCYSTSVNAQLDKVCEVSIEVSDKALDLTIATVGIGISS